MIRWVLPIALVAAIGAGGAMAASATLGSSAASVKAVDNAKFGMVLVAANGRTLYRYTLDSKGVNRCTKVAICAKYWSRLLVKPGVKPAAGSGVKASLLGTMKATGGMRQVTYARWPLYTFAGDSKAGQTNGENFQKQWYVVNTKGALVKHAVSSGSTSTPPSTGGTTTGGSYTWG